MAKNFALFDDLASEYDEWFDKDGKMTFDIEVKAFRHLLSGLPEPWLEIGVGSGRFAQALGVKYGVDPSEKFVGIANERGITTRIGKGEDKTYDKESFGTAFIIVTICFVDSPLAVLNETYRILKPGGKVVLGLVLKNSPWGQFYQQLKAEGHRFYSHATFYDYEEVANLLTKAGFVTGRTISTLFQKPGNVHHMEDPLLDYSPDAGFTIIEGLKVTHNHSSGIIGK